MATPGHGGCVCTVQDEPWPFPDRLSDPFDVQPPPCGPRPSFLSSSQGQHWMFSAATLASMRMATNEKLRALLKKRATAPPAVLSVDDELAITRFYLLRIGRLVRAFSLPPLVEATAMSLMKRFYLRNSTMQFHPKLIMLTSVFLAAKAENYPVSLRRFCDQVNGSGKAREGPASMARGDVTESIIRDLEFGMVQSLGFELSVHDVHRALYGFILEIQTVDTSLTRDELVAFAGAVQPVLHLARLTDAEFIYAPAQIALAACWMSAAPRNVQAGGSLDGRALVRAWLDAKSQTGAALRISEKKQREAAREKLRALSKSRSASATPSAEGHAEPAAAELPDAALGAEGLGIPGDELVAILEDIARLVRAAADGDSTRPKLDMDHVKKIDLDLRACLAEFEADPTLHGRKRSASDLEDGAKRARMDTQSDSDDAA
ncbi:hypothetical protein MSPP1_003099 [Malassezia sp. CBS 17886]|nr:hypothetical protein MSPP1_003099 [Malassezia sp. CBS 17886]